MALTATVPKPTGLPSIYGMTPPPAPAVPGMPTPPRPLLPVTRPGVIAQQPITPQPPTTPAPTPGTFSATNNTINSQIQPAPSTDLTKYRGLLSTAADNLGHLPDRYQTAQSQFDTFAKSTEPQYQADLADATKLASANGTLGSGMLGDRYGSIANQRALALDTQRNNFLTDALNGSIDDRYRSLGAFDTVAGDTAQQEANARNEQRTERGYQYGTSQDATQTAIQQYQAQQQAQNQNFQQGVELDQLGNTKTHNALDTYNNASGQYGQDASSAFGALGRSLNQSQIQKILASLGQTGTNPSALPPGVTLPDNIYRPIYG